MRNFIIAKEGVKLIIPSFLLSVILFVVAAGYALPVLYIPAGLVGFFCLFAIYFFRNPKRGIDGHSEDLISPADGKITDIREMVDTEFMGGECTRITVFMSPADVHVNRAPCEGTVTKTKHVPGDFAMAFKKDCDLENERNHILIEKGPEKIMLVQIAGFLARRIIPYVKPGDVVKQCQPIGLIAFGSRVDIYFSKKYTPVIQLGNKVKAGLTVLAEKKG